MAFCPKCNALFDEADGFCPYDGTTLQPGAPQKPKPQLRAISAAEGGADVIAKLVGRDPKEEYRALIGTTLDGRYHIEKQLGEGGMGVVLLAKHIIIEKLVAIKVLKREVARDHSVVKRFVQEAKAASRIGHPNIVDVTDFGTTPDGMTYSVMEFVEGETLSAVIKRQAPLPVSRALPIIAQIAKALGAAHDKGIVHRDLKPENVFVLDRDGRRDFVKIVDFGIAKVMPADGGSSDGPRLTRVGTVFGTPEYMAPEQAAGRGDTDKRVDVYALGTIFYEMLVGHVPHKGNSTVRTLAMQMLDPIQPPRQARPELDISGDFEQVMMRALAKKRDERYPDMAAFISDVERVAGGVPLAQPLSASTGAVAVIAGADERTLMPVPPGADAVKTQLENLNADRETVRAQLPEGAATTPEAVPTARRSAKSDPAFLGSGVDFDHDFGDDSYIEDRPSRTPLAVALLLVFAAGAVVAGYLVLKTDDGRATEAARPAIDAAVLADVPVDAGVPADATIVAEVPIDARSGKPPGIRHTGHKRIDAGAGTAIRPPDHGNKRLLQVQIVTKPERGTLYVGRTYSGTGDTYLRRREGTKLSVTCRRKGFQSGRVEVSFDGVTEVYLCSMKRVKKCIKDLKNPFDDCPE